ncbi:lantibiotic dehydratase [Streptomyces cocklensis]|uniref:Thiopeptide-type bacteriocin biosynthesis domain-containing protein n=1 Tax=Actinacidiphila cocklensis TaxID=887465 RepID=A0A9W4DUA5_9ACTN|nr:lantibiotic dehydratase [Actinacidiphila cocklensis]MDD1062838.1 lantibiotic dehydratase [Actinacidiphila cocklensis]CAG6394092.1 Thiopeptide-type bacteriocin biosynthesis domain-containing protein [Actinacidiphila cocklensis]
MAPRAAVTYRWQGPALLRASTSPGVADLPRMLDLDDAAETRMWLDRIWQQEAFRDALRAATPVLSAAVEAVAGGQETRPRQVRRTALSTISYLLRWQNRSTPLGLFAGTAAVAVGDTARIQWRERHHVLLRADAEWVADIIGRLHSSPELLRRLPLVANNTARERGNRLVAVGAPADAYAQLMAPIEISVHNARPVAAAVAAAREPITYDDLRSHLHTLFPQATVGQIDRLLRDLVGQQILLSSLWAPMTTMDAFGHLCAELERHDADTIPDLHDLVTALFDVRDEIAAHQPASATAVLDRLFPKMCVISPATPTPLIIDTGLDCEAQIPAAVLDEVQAAVTALYRTTSQPYGYQHWRDYHRRFRARYGVGAHVPVMELISDSGLGLPAGYLGSERGRPPKLLTDRDQVLLALLQDALMDGGSELVLTDKVIDTLADAAATEPHFVPRVEAAFEIHAPSTTALTRGAFQVAITAVPRPGSSMAGRFAHLLAPDHHEVLADGYHTDPDALTAQLSFPPRKRRTENVTRTPRLLPHVIAVGEHPAADGKTIDLDDIAVTADARHFYLIRRSTGHRVDVRVLHALEAATQTPAPARFLAEVAGARYAAYKPFDFGAAAHLPYLPRVRYRRTILAPARWLLTADELPGRASEQDSWDGAFDTWRTRLRVPDAVSMIEHDQRLPVDLRHPVHRRLLRTQLDQNRRLELREAPAADAHGWIGRAHEVWIALHRTGPAPTAEDGPHGSLAYGAEPPRLHLSGAGNVLYARLHAHPARYDEILTQHLPTLLAALGDTASLWWFTRHRETARPDADQYLDLVFHLAPGTYAVAAECVHDWTGTLHRTGLAAGLTLADYRPQTGRFGHGDAMDAAHQVFAADSAAAVAQIRFTGQNDTVTPQALAAASALDLVQHLAPSEAEGTDWLIQRLPQVTGRLDPHLREQVLDLTAPGGRAALGVLPEDDAVTQAWKARAAALDAYRLRLAGADPLRAARSLLHQHHVRALVVDPTAEAVTLRLARTAALRQQKAVR